MPKYIELTVEIVVQRVSCPGVWLCQDGSVSLIVYALGTSYETCMLPPTFPLQFNDKLYFRKRFEDNCALSNICCLLKDETLYCELVQWCQNCEASECNILAQYLGSLSDVLFPPKMCCNDGVDLLMRRSKKYPGILSPKIEIATKVRIDEVWNAEHKPHINIQNINNINNCHCTRTPAPRQKTVCHSADYHRKKCVTGIPCSKSRSRSRSRSRNSSCVSLRDRVPDKSSCAYSEPTCKPRVNTPPPRRRCRRDYCVLNVQIPAVDKWNSATGNSDNGEHDDSGRYNQREPLLRKEDKKVLLESRFVDTDERAADVEEKPTHTRKYDKKNYTPCICEICRRYHELFHADSDIQVSWNENKLE